jgi:hypothetical protein
MAGNACRVFGGAGAELTAVMSDCVLQFVVWNATLGSVVHRNYIEYFDSDTNTTMEYRFPPELFKLLPLNEPTYDYSAPPPSRPPPKQTNVEMIHVSILIAKRKTNH